MSGADAILAVMAVGTLGAGLGVAGQGLISTGAVDKIEYCRQPSGAVTVGVLLLVRVENRTSTPIILSRVTTVGGYQLSKHRVGALPLLNYTASREEIVDDSGFDTYFPPADLFDILHPGATVKRAVRLDFPFEPLQRAMSGPQAEYWLRVRLRHWPSSLARVSKLRRGWARYGLLWTEDSDVAPVALTVQREPNVGRCVGRFH